MRPAVGRQACKANGDLPFENTYALGSRVQVAVKDALSRQTRQSRLLSDDAKRSYREPGSVLGEFRG